MNRKKAVLIAIAIIILIPTLFMTWFIYTLELKRETIDKSDDGRFKYRVVVQEVGTPMYFGPSDVRIVFEHFWGKNIKVINDVISNDGKTIDSSNVTVEWRENYVDVTLYGEEQKPKVHRFEY